jgi:hypothetical protein
MWSAANDAFIHASLQRFWLTADETAETIYMLLLKEVLTRDAGVWMIRFIRGKT